MSILVVARWQEDTSWVASVPPGWRVNVVQKDTDLPNRGREPSSFLWWIIRRYNRLGAGAVYGFVQGDPFPHAPDLFDRLDDTTVGFRPLSPSPPFRSTGDGSPHHQGVPVADCYQRWLGVPMPGEVEFWPGGQFLIDGASLLRHPRGFYRAVFDDLMARDGLEPWAAERLWPAMFKEAA